MQFMKLLGQVGINIDMPKAKELLQKVLGGGAFTRDLDTREAQAASGSGRSIGEQAGNLLGPLASPFHAAAGVVEAALAPITPWTTEDANQQFSAAGSDFTDFGEQIGNYFTSPADVAADANARTSARSAPPQARTDMIDRSGNVTEGRVTGNVTITVDQQGRVSAPPSVTISGSQKATNAGFGGGTMNNPSPGDPAFQHAMPSLSGG